jgi:hypothetical protein
MSVIRRYNYTGRHKIPRQWIRIEIFRQKGKNLEVDFSLDIEAMREKFPDIPGDALILLEPYYKTEAWDRIACGTVDNHQPLLKRVLENRFWEDQVNFNVKIVSTDEGPARILAWNQRMKVEEADETGKKQRSLLAVVPKTDMGPRFWKLDFEGDYPELHVNADYNLEGASPKEIVRSDPGFHTFAYPLIVEQVLRTIIIDKADTYDQEADETGWITFASEKLQAGRPPEYEPSENEIPEEVIVWINDVVSRFCNYHDLKPLFESYWASNQSTYE